MAADRKEQLIELTNRLVAAFNNMDLDGVVELFSDDGIYEDSSGGSHRGHEEIRRAFKPMLDGSRGSVEFAEEDIFVEADTGKVLTRWTLKLSNNDKVAVMRGLDILEFNGDKLTKKMAYMKADKPHLEAC